MMLHASTSFGKQREFGIMVLIVQVIMKHASLFELLCLSSQMCFYKSYACQLQLSRLTSEIYQDAHSCLHAGADPRAWNVCVRARDVFLILFF